MTNSQWVTLLYLLSNWKTALCFKQSELLPLFGEQPTGLAKFSRTVSAQYLCFCVMPNWQHHNQPMAYQILVGNISMFNSFIFLWIIYNKAINIIARQSFWIMKPFQNSVMDALEELKSNGYVEKLKDQITSTSVPSKHQDLLDFLYNQVIHIWW